MEQISDCLFEGNKIFVLAIFDSCDFIVSTIQKLLLYDSNYKLINTIAIDKNIYSICIKNQNIFYTGNEEGVIEEWEQKRNKQRTYKKTKISSNAHWCEISKLLLINNYIYSSSYDGTIKIRNIEKRDKIDETLYEIKDLESVYSIIYDENNKLLICGANKGFYIWNVIDIKDKKIDKIYEDEKSKIYSPNSLQFLKQNNGLVEIIIGSENWIKIYSVTKIEEKFNVDLKQTIKIDYICSAITFLQSDTQIILITGELKNIDDDNDENYKIRLYQNLNDQNPIIINYAHCNKINGFIQYSNNTLFSYSNDGLIKFWNIKVDKENYIKNI